MVAATFAAAQHLKDNATSTATRRGYELSMEPSTIRAEELHAEAQKCKRLASETTDPVVREGLIDLVSDYERQAERLEKEQREATKSFLTIEAMTHVFFWGCIGVSLSLIGPLLWLEHRHHGR
jgi:hypothetical protein